MSASLAVYVCPPHSACCIRSYLTSYSTLPGDGYSCTFRFVYETPFFLDPFSTCVISCFICVAEETNPFCQRCNICTICTFPRMHENTMPTCHIVHHVLFNVMWSSVPELYVLLTDILFQVWFDPNLHWLLIIVYPKIYSCSPGFN